MVNLCRTAGQGIVIPVPGNEITGVGTIDTKKKALFITGASGFLGMRILERLDPGGYSRITLLSRGLLQLPKRLAAADCVDIIQGAIHDIDKYAPRLDSNTVVLHLAAVTGKAEPRDYYTVNTYGTAELLKVSTLADIAGFLFVSSIAVSFSDREGYHYAESKQQAEKRIRESGLKYTIARPTIILGKGSPIWGSFASLSRSSIIFLPGTGKVRIQPIYIDDVVDLLLGIVSGNRFKGETLELGGPESLSMDDFVRRIHRSYRGGRGRVVHIPLGLVLSILHIVEKRFPTLLPVSSGQFSSFYNDGTAVENDLPQSVGSEIKTVDEMLEQLTGKV